MFDLKFDLGDDLSVSDLRKVDQWERRLAVVGKLRLQRRGELLGVLLSPKAWLDLKEQTERYERALQMIEDEHDRRVISEREGSTTLRGEVLRRALESEHKTAEIL